MTLLTEGGVLNQVQSPNFTLILEDLHSLIQGYGASPSHILQATEICKTKAIHEAIGQAPAGDEGRAAFNTLKCFATCEAAIGNWKHVLQNSLNLSDSDIKLGQRRESFGAQNGEGVKAYLAKEEQALEKLAYALVEFNRCPCSPESEAEVAMQAAKQRRLSIAKATALLQQAQAELVGLHDDQEARKILTRTIRNLPALAKASLRDADLDLDRALAMMLRAVQEGYEIAAKFLGAKDRAFTIVGTDSELRILHRLFQGSTGFDPFGVGPEQPELLSTIWIGTTGIEASRTDEFGLKMQVILGMDSTAMRDLDLRRTAIANGLALATYLIAVVEARDVWMQFTDDATTVDDPADFSELALEAAGLF